jgi:hypothetical protein
MEKTDIKSIECMTSACCGVSAIPHLKEHTSLPDEIFYTCCLCGKITGTKPEGMA